MFAIFGKKTIDSLENRQASQEYDEEDVASGIISYSTYESVDSSLFVDKTPCSSLASPAHQSAKPLNQGEQTKGNQEQDGSSCSFDTSKEQKTIFALLSGKRATMLIAFIWLLVVITAVVIPVSMATIKKNKEDGNSSSTVAQGRGENMSSPPMSILPTSPPVLTTLTPSEVESSTEAPSRLSPTDPPTTEPPLEPPTEPPSSPPETMPPTQVPTHLPDMDPPTDPPSPPETDPPTHVSTPSETEDNEKEELEEDDPEEEKPEDDEPEDDEHDEEDWDEEEHTEPKGKKNKETESKGEHLHGKKRKLKEPGDDEPYIDEKKRNSGKERGRVTT